MSANEALFHFHSFMPRTKSARPSMVKLKLQHSLSMKNPVGFFIDYITDSSNNLFSFILFVQ